MSLLSFGYMSYEVMWKNESKLVPQEQTVSWGNSTQPQGESSGF